MYYKVSFTRVYVRSLSGHCPVVIRSLSGHCPVIVRSLSGHCPVTVRSLSGHYPAVVRPLSGHSLYKRSKTRHFTELKKNITIYIFISTNVRFTVCRQKANTKRIQKFYPFYPTKRAIYRFVDKQKYFCNQKQ